MNTKNFKPGWPGMLFALIPGADCDTCRNTGYRVLHGAPRRGDGRPHFDSGCHCGRDPIQFLHDEVTRKFALANAPVVNDLTRDEAELLAEYRSLKVDPDLNQCFTNSISSELTDILPGLTVRIGLCKPEIE